MERKGRLALVTGTTSGIGLALASALLKGGWEVTGLARRPAPLEADNYTHLVADLSDPGSLELLALEHLIPLLIREEVGRLALINNAAMIGALRPVDRAQASHLTRMFAVNATAPITLMGLALRHVPTSTPLRIVNISSGAAHSPLPGLGDYSATKAALRLAGMTAAAEIEAAPDRRDAAVLSYEPGLVDTPMQDRTRDQSPQDFPSQGTFQDFAEQGLLNPPAAVVGEIIDFLAGDPSSAFTEKRFGDS